jgi:hypothetical protein
VTELLLDKLTRAILIAVSVVMATCYAWELKSTAYQSLVEMEHSWIRERRRISREEERERLKRLHGGDEFVPPLTSHSSEASDVW